MKNSIFLLPFIIFTISCTHNIKPETFDYHFAKGNRFLAKQSFNEAIVHYEKAISKNPHIPEAHYNLSIALHNKREGLISKNKEDVYKKQRSEYIKNKSQGNFYFIPPSLTTEAYHLEKRYLKSLRTAIRLNDRISGAHYLLGSYYFKEGDHKKAKEEYRRAFEINPKNKQSYKAYLNLYEKECENFAERFQEANAIECYENMIAFDPNNDQIRCELAHFYYESGMNSEALKIYHYLKKKDSKLIEKIQYIFDNNQ